MATITKTITQPDEVIEAFADWKGYQTEVRNPNYDDTDPSSTPTIPNTQTRIEYVSELFDEYALDFFLAFTEFQAKKDVDNQINTAIENQRTALKQTISTTIS